METDIAKTIYEKVQILPTDEQKAVLKFVDGLQLESEQKRGQSLKDLWRSIDERAKQIPDEAWDEVPTDGAENHDHYLYGAPKKQK